MQLHNTMSRTVETIKPLHKDKIALYTCGPTVYNYLQLGNWITYVRWDILVRTLQASGYDVNWVMNITDVGHLTSDADEGEDKLEKGAKREGKTAWQVAEFYTQDFFDTARALNIQKPTVIAKATDHIAEQIDLIKKLEAKDFTYIIDDGVYFDTSKLDDYGKLARLKIDELRAGARVELNQQKRNITDFALWKFSPKGTQRDMEWDSPWGIGFPGWHLECSAMAMKYLGDTIDIHAGGIDHIPVHHTNEIAQSEAATGKPFANLWLHGNFLMIDGAKLSKSLGNSYTVHDVIAKGFDPLDLRMLFLQSHYRTEANFTWEGLEAAQNRRKHWQEALDQLWLQSKHDDSIPETFQLRDYQTAILTSLQNDLDTPQVLADIDGTLQAMTDTPQIVDPKDAQEFFVFLDNILGLNFIFQDITDNQKTLIATRETARQSKDFAKSDQIRDELLGQGIGVRDTSHGPIWYRV